MDGPLTPIDTFTASQIVAVSVATSADPEPASGGDWLNAYRAPGAEAFTLDVGRELQHAVEVEHGVGGLRGWGG